MQPLLFLTFFLPLSFGLSLSIDDHRPFYLLMTTNISCLVSQALRYYQ